MENRKGSVRQLAHMKSLRKLFVVVAESQGAQTRRNLSHRNWPIRFRAPVSDDRHNVKALKEVWNKVLRRYSDFEQLASVEVGFTTVHLMKDKKAQLAMACQMIRDEIRKIAPVEQIRKPQNVFQLPLMR
jgi:hypothetical protein